MKTPVILNRGDTAWLFSSFAKKSADVLWLNVSEAPADFNYILGCDDRDLTIVRETFIPFIFYRNHEFKRTRFTTTTD